MAYSQPYHLQFPLTATQIEQLDEMVRELYLQGQINAATASAASASAAAAATGSSRVFMLGLDGDDGADGFPVPGPAGARGASGISIPGMDGDDGEAGPPGPPGATGATGATGAAGPAGGPKGPPGVDGEDGDSGWPMFPGTTPSTVRVPITGQTFSANLGGTWSVATIATFEYVQHINSDLVTIFFDFETATVTGSPTILSVSLPFTVAAATQNPAVLADAGTVLVGFCLGAAAATKLQFIRIPETAWTASAGGTAVTGQITLRKL